MKRYKDKRVNCINWNGHFFHPYQGSLIDMVMVHAILTISPLQGAFACFGVNDASESRILAKDFPISHTPAPLSSWSQMSERASHLNELKSQLIQKLRRRMLLYLSVLVRETMIKVLDAPICSLARHRLGVMYVRRPSRELLPGERINYQMSAAAQLLRRNASRFAILTFA